LENHCPELNKLTKKHIFWSLAAQKETARFYDQIEMERGGKIRSIVVVE